MPMHRTDLLDKWIRVNDEKECNIVEIPIGQYKIKVVLARTMESVEFEDMAVTYNGIDITDRLIECDRQRKHGIATTGLNLVKLIGLVMKDKEVE